MPDSAIGMGPQDRAERDRFESEVKRIVEAGNAARVTLRVLGSLAFQTHCPRFGYLQEKMGRAYTDIDFAGYSREAKGVRSMLAGLGYAEEQEVFVVTEGGRAIFENPKTIPLAEMLLEKMQIVKINEKDVIDTIMLLLEHPLGDDDHETINMQRVAGLCSGDWGLWRTVTMNLGKVEQLAQAYPQLDGGHKSQVVSQVQTALARIEAEPKSMAWRLRSRVGDRVKWYKDVEEVD
jgi:hypothetical protein